MAQLTTRSNHFHLVAIHRVTLSPFMQWRMTSHVRRCHQHYRSHGPIWQGRFKSFPFNKTTISYRTALRPAQFHAREAGGPRAGLGLVASARPGTHRFPPHPIVDRGTVLAWPADFATRSGGLRTRVNRYQSYGSVDWR